MSSWNKLNPDNPPSQTSVNNLTYRLSFHMQLLGDSVISCHQNTKFFNCFWFWNRWCPPPLLLGSSSRSHVPFCIFNIIRRHVYEVNFQLSKQFQAFFVFCKCLPRLWSISWYPLTAEWRKKKNSTYSWVWCFYDRASWIDYILITNLMNWLLFIHEILHSSTCFEP